MKRALTRGSVTIDTAALEQELGVPVVATAARSGEGLPELKDTIAAVSQGHIVATPKRIPYDPELQQAIDELLPLVEAAFPHLPNARWIALRLIDGSDQRLREEVEKGLLADPLGETGDTLAVHTPPLARAAG